MKRIRMIYTLTLKDGRQISTTANNRVEAFDRMALLYPIETEGFTFRDLSERYGGIGVHSCANSKHQWPQMRKIKGLKLVNLIQPEPIIEASIPFFADTAAQFPAGCPAELTLKPEFEGIHLVTTIDASGMDRARIAELSARLRG